MITTEFWEALVETLEEGHSAFLALVVGSSSGSPGTPGAALFVRPDGSQVGTVGGGIMEFNLLAAARDAMAADRFVCRLEVLWHRKDAPGKPSGMICSGQQTNLYYLCRPAADLALFRDILGGSRIAGSEILVADAQGLRVEQGPDAAAPIVLDAEQWEVRIRLGYRARIAIIGGGHCGCALSHTMRRLGYIVSVLDTRADATLFLDNLDAHQRILIQDYAEAGSRIEAPEATAVVVMTTDYPSDVKALTGTLPLPVPFLGVMGSQAKLNHIRGDLRRAGFSDHDLDRLRAPVGIPIGSHTPEEIAISIAAQLIKEASPHPVPGIPGTG